ncbi:DMT family transporter [Candidatus Bipolaricaulota bacterium]|nr:DMT family transporter [Candidatus Bipolaricaulota bacterium]
MAQRSRLHGWLIPVGLVAVSFGSILVRLAGEAPPLVIAAWRMGCASLVLIPVAIQRHALRGISRRDVLLSIISGGFLALHFAFWIHSLSATSVASSTVLVSTSPIFVAIGSWFLLRERISRRQFMGISLSVAGSVMVSRVDFGGAAHVGDLLALGGAAMSAAYLIVGRGVRQRVSILAYITLMYTSAAVALIFGCLILRQPLFGYAPNTVLYLVLLAVIPQLIGHSSFNALLGRFRASTVSIVLLAEPIGSSALAYLILGEAVNPLQAVGGLLILIGIYVSVSKEASHAAKLD